MPVNQENPYQAPASAAEPGAAKPPRRWGVMLLSLIVFQTLLAVIYASTMFSQLKLGEISGLTFLASALASVLLVVGGLLYVFRIRYASYLFFASAFFAAFVYWQWRPTFVFTGLAISVCAGLVSIAFQRRFASA